MEIKPNPATPPSGATPGSDANVVTTPSSTTPTGQESVGKVTIDLKEYRDLQRAKARTLSFEKRTQINRSKNSHQPTNDDGNDDPEIVEKLAQSEQARVDAERRATRVEVQSKVRDLLEKEEFKNLPPSTRNLILKNPAMLSEADNVDEALLDIEDFVRDQVSLLDASESQGSSSREIPIAKNEIPPVINNGTPAPTVPDGMEDTSNLRGADRTRALIRNKMKVTKGNI